MLNRHYEQELSHLRKLGTQFARANPALAPLLGADRASDPDVERLLEGVAFLTGLVHQRLDDDFPEFIQNMAQLLFPHFLQPVPCMTIMQFAPQGQLEQAQTLPAGTEFASRAIDGQPMRFRSSFPVTIEPVEIQSIQWEGGTTKARVLRLDMRFTGATPQSWAADSLRFFLGNSHADATRLYLLLMRYVREIHIAGPQGPVTVLPASSIKPAGLRSDLHLLPWPSNAHPAWRVLHEYFALPEKFLFVDLEGFSQWPAQGQSPTFTIRFLLDQTPTWTPEMNASSLVLNATPAVNLFSAHANPIRVSHQQIDYKIAPVTRNSQTTEPIYSVDHVTARTAQGTERQYHAFSAFDDPEESSAYNLRIRPSALDRDYDYFLSLPYSDQRDLEPLTLSVALTCTQGNRPHALRLGDIREHTDKSPPRMTFRNILGVTQYRAPNFDSELLWRVLSHLSANHLSLSNANQLRDLLSLYAPDQKDASQHHSGVQKIVTSIESVQIKPERRFVRGVPIQGSEVIVRCRGEQFPSTGSLYLFGAVLDELLAATVALNTFSALTLIDTSHGETLKWPAKIGQMRLM